MHLDVREIADLKTPRDFVARAILEKLKEGKKVLWFVPGGSCIPLAVEISKELVGPLEKNLIVTLTDERYGEVWHKNSNLAQLFEKGFSLTEAEIYSVLADKSLEKTVADFDSFLNKSFQEVDYKIGLFGIGADGHTAGILPGSEAVDARSWVYGYNGGEFERITLTACAIESLDEVVVYTEGERKRQVIEDLNKDIEINKMPAQVLKKVPKLTIFFNSQ